MKIAKKPVKKKFSFKKMFISVKNWYKSLSLIKKIIFPLIPLVVVVALVILLSKVGSNKVTYETATATKGTLIVSTSTSGTITSGNYTNITTKVSGTVKKVYVTNGDTVTKGQKLAEVTLDEYATERQASAWKDYLLAVEAVNTAKIAKITSDKNMWQDRQNLLDAETKYNNMIAGAWNPDTKAEYTYNEKAVVTKNLEIARLTFSADQTKYNDADASITAAQTSVTSTYQDYLLNSATIVAPASGTVSDLALFEGLSVSANTSTSSTTGSTIVSSQTVGKINNPKGQLIATVSMSEGDILNIKANQKVIITVDAYSDMTFTGKVLAVNTSGTSTSSVTSYPVTILLDKTDVAIYPNMAIEANIITNSVTNAIMVPTTAITTTGNASSVQIMKNGKPVTTTVEIGTNNDSYTEIKSGVNESDIVVTSTITADTSNKDDATSLFTGTSTSTNKSSSTRSFSNFGGGMGGGMPPGM